MEKSPRAGYFAIFTIIGISIMVNILVLTDFSDLSKVAIRYAIKVANKLNGNVTLLHVITVLQPTRASVQLKIKSLEKEMVEYAGQDMQELIEEMTRLNKTGTPLKYRIEKGQYLPETVKRVAKSAHSGLIIMGTKGASGLKKYVMGSNATSVIEVSHIPVMAIPQKAEFKGFRNIVYPTNMESLGKKLKTMLPYVKIFESKVHVMHVVPPGKSTKEAEAKLKDALKAVDFKSYEIRVVASKDIDGSIDAYVTQTKADLVAMFTHKHSFYSRLFNRSITRQLAFQIHMPLLAFKLD